jgi:hypothetical protein
MSFKRKYQKVVNLVDQWLSKAQNFKSSNLFFFFKTKSLIDYETLQRGKVNLLICMRCKCNIRTNLHHVGVEMLHFYFVNKLS